MRKKDKAYNYDIVAKLPRQNGKKYKLVPEETAQPLFPSYCEKCVFKVNYDKFHDARMAFEHHTKDIEAEPQTISCKVTDILNCPRFEWTPNVVCEK